MSFAASLSERLRSISKVVAVLGMLPSATQALPAPVPKLVKDINTAPNRASGFGYESGMMVNLNGTLVFPGVDPLHGQQLWRSDGTPSGTRLLKVINSGSAGTDFSPVGLHDGCFYFVASGKWSSGLWKTDGTADGTVKLLDVGLTQQVVGASVSAGGSLYFVDQSFSAWSGAVLYRTDGTPQGTVALNYRHFFPDWQQFYDPSNLQVLGDTLYFVTFGREIWKTDGTEAGSVKVAQLAGEDYSVTSSTVFQGVLYYTLTSYSTQVEELWKSNGTAAGTALVKSIPKGTAGIIDSLQVAGNTLFFRAYDQTHGIELWKSTGTTAGTTVLKDLYPGTQSSSPGNFTTMNGALYFKATTSAGTELWKSTGTSAGTSILKNLNAGAASSNPSQLSVLGNTLYFNADDGGGTKLWKTTGTPVSTVMVQNSAAPGIGIDSPAAVGSKLYFGSYQTASGKQLWETDGTVAGTRMVTDLNKGTADSIPTQSAEDYPWSVAVFHGEFYFQADDGVHGGELWKSDGTSEGTALVKDLLSGPEPSQPGGLGVLGDTLYFRAQSIPFGEYWKSDGTSIGTIRVTDPLPVYGISSTSSDVMLDGIRYTVHDDGIHGKELWRTDGTVGGTYMVKNIGRDGLSSTGPTFLTNFHGKIYFSADDGWGLELWMSDGTEAGTLMVKDIQPYSGSSAPQDLFVAGDTLYFIATSAFRGNRQLWKSDGSATGTTLVADLMTNDLYYTRMSWLNGRLRFCFKAGDHSELWESDGTTAGTSKIVNIPPQLDAYRAPVSDRTWVWAERYAYFIAGDVSTGQELWKTDGTVAGTGLVKEIRPGEESSDIRGIVAVGSSVYFSADDGIHGRELWKSDGTVAGTVMVADFTEGDPGSSNPAYLTLIGSRLFFAATTAATGAELYTLDVSGDLEPSFDEWASAAGLTGPDALPSATPRHDGVKNLLKFAFNLNPAVPDSRMLPFGTGDAGLPNFRLMQSGGTSTFRVEFLRRRNSGLTYVPQISASMAVESFVPMTGTTTVTPLDSDWERVAVEQAVDTTVTPRLFGRVSVSQP